ncbi:serine/threonine-protein kinase atm [Phtheirospermum japonicum]|uniref:Serine/threonine-protein kinase atm n=1 Tax=Phtheirospermum japonicum TaxID=374723 RepID=A0A830CAE1_9LAMI|nr:serine/threonine-protein kinase atm [Phtheirospermum japonicum]
MEDEQGDAGGVSVLPLSEKLPAEPFLGNMGGNNKLQSSFEDEDGDGIMVEIVGCDVFVNGVSGEKEGCFEDLEGHALQDREETESRNFSEAIDGNQMGESVIGFVGPREEHDYVVISEDKAMKDGSVDKDTANLEISEVLAVVEAEKEGVLSSNDNAEKTDHSGEDGVFEAEAVNASIDGDCICGIDVEIVNEKTLSAESKDSVFETEFHGFKCEPLHGFDDALDFKDGPTEQSDGGEIAEASEDNSQTVEHIGPEIPAENAHLPTNERESDVKHNGEKTAVNSSGPELETDERASETDNLNSGPCYLLHEGNFVPSSLVWGKVRSHPWWPGQIFDPSDASKKAIKNHKKKGSYLVANFGDQTFAWIDKSNLKPFVSNFPKMERQSNSEAVQNAVAKALEEVSRRVELGLVCSCVPKDDYAKIEAQVVKNPGIKLSQRYGVDHSSRASCFEPVKFLEHVTNLACFTFSGPDRLDHAIARAQLSAFRRFNEYCSKTKFENDADSEKTSNRKAGSKKRKQAPNNGSHSSKNRSSVEFVAEGEYSGRKRKISGSQDDGPNLRLAKVSEPAGQNPTKHSFRIGEGIRRAASRLTGPTSSSVEGNNNNNAEMVIDENINEHSLENQNVSVEEMLSQLEVTAQNPEKGNNDIGTFFTGYRSSIASNRRVQKEKDELEIGGNGEEFEFDDTNDSYWTDRIVMDETKDKSVRSGRKLDSRKRFSDLTTVIGLGDENVKRREKDSLPAELILNFAEKKCVPSEIKLNKTLRRFGPLMESETEVDHDSGRAKVIFKRGCDAEVALSSAEKISIFGPVLVSYQIGYEPLISVKISPIMVPQFQEDKSLMI